MPAARIRRSISARSLPRCDVGDGTRDLADELVGATRTVDPHVRREQEARVGLTRGRNRALEQRQERRQPGRQGRVDAEHRGVGAGHRAHDIVDARGIADERRHVIRQLRTLRIAHERDNVVLCGRAASTTLRPSPPPAPSTAIRMLLDPLPNRASAHLDLPPSDIRRDRDTARSSSNSSTSRRSAANSNTRLRLRRMSGSVTIRMTSGGSPGHRRESVIEIVGLTHPERQHRDADLLCGFCRCLTPTLAWNDITFRYDSLGFWNHMNVR